VVRVVASVARMSESKPVNPAESGLEIPTHFVRHRNVLLARADFAELYVDYFLHLGEQKILVAPEHAELFKRALAGFALHCASRPRNEMTAWTMNFQEPLVNLFLTGDNETGAITGRVFSEDVKQLESNVFYCDVVKPGQPRRRSAVNFNGADPLSAVETFYAQSEQRPARFFQTAEEEFALVSEHPDCDIAWMQGLGTEAVRDIAKTETLSLLERRLYRWHCGCNQQRMMEVLSPVMRQDPVGLFGESEKVEIRCPRCAARHAITREAMEAFVAKKP
jgi:molecular chaperone Hsp33